MTKKSKQQTLSVLNRHHSQRIQRGQIQPNSLQSMSISKRSKKSIKKPQHQFQLIDKVQILKQKSSRFYKHAQKKIDRMIQIIQQIDEKHLKNWTRQSKVNNNQIDNKVNNVNLELKQQEMIQMNNQTQKQRQYLDSYIPNKQQKDLINKTLTHLHNLLTYQKPLTHIKHQFESFYSKLSAFSKQLNYHQPLPQDRQFLIQQKGLTFQELKHIQQLIKQHYLRTGYFNVAQLFDQYGKQEQNQIKQSNLNIQEKTQKVKNNHKQQKIQQTHKQSKKQKSKKISPKKKPKVQLIDLQQNFKECFTLRHQLLAKKFSQAINWCAQQRLYETHTNSLQYELRLAEIKLLIHEKKYKIVFDKIQKQMVKFLQNYQDQIILLIGYLLFSCSWNAQQIFDQSQSNQRDNKKDGIIIETTQHQQQFLNRIINSRYSKFLINTLNINQLAQKFTHQYFIHYDISQFDTLQICYRVGKLYQQQYFQSIKMFSQKDGQQFLKHRGHCQFDDKNTGLPHTVILPFQIPVKKQHLYHSIFVCPVTKQVLSSNDGVEYLSCGHLVSQSAKKNMAQVRRSNHKQKCPVCQKDRAPDVVKVRF